MAELLGVTVPIYYTMETCEYSFSDTHKPHGNVLTYKELIDQAYVVLRSLDQEGPDVIVLLDELSRRVDELERRLDCTLF